MSETLDRRTVLERLGAAAGTAVVGSGVAAAEPARTGDTADVAAATAALVDDESVARRTAEQRPIGALAGDATGTAAVPGTRWTVTQRQTTAGTVRLFRDGDGSAYAVVDDDGERRVVTDDEAVTTASGCANECTRLQCQDVETVRNVEYVYEKVDGVCTLVDTVCQC